MKKRHRIGAVLLAAMLLGGCGAAKESMYQETSASAADAAPAEAPAYESAPIEGEKGYYSVEFEEEAVEDADAGGGVTATSGIESVGAVSQKLIKTVNMSLETKEFDALLENIRQKVEDIGGYIEYSDISGSSYYSVNVNSNRNAWLTLRIPADKLDGFVTVVSELGNVTNKNESVEDITLRYVDVESHKKALETEQSRLLELLEKAESMEDIIAIESRLSEVRYELQSYESTLRTYDNQVSYSTVALNIYEVERITEVPEEESFFDEVRYRLSDNLYSIGRDLRSFAIWLLSSLPYLLFWAAAIVVVYLIIRRIVRKKPFFAKRRRRGNEESATDGGEQEKK